MAKKKKAKRKRYEVEVTRIGISSQTFTVETTSKKKAEKIAMKQAPSFVFYDDDAFYKIENVMER